MRKKLPFSNRLMRIVLVGLACSTVILVTYAAYFKVLLDESKDKYQKTLTVYSFLDEAKVNAANLSAELLLAIQTGVPGETNHAEILETDIQTALKFATNPGLHTTIQTVAAAISTSVKPKTTEFYNLLKRSRKEAQSFYFTQFKEARAAMEGELNNARLRSVEEIMALRNSQTGIMVTSLLAVFLSLVIGGLVSLLSRRIANRLSRDFQNTSDTLSVEAKMIASVSKTVSSAANELSASSTQQASAITEAVTSMEEMTSMVGQTTQHASSSLQVAEESKTEAERGMEVISRMSSAMDDIQASNSKLESLVNLIEEIKNKTRVINDIVFETRLLSFNASIEAARAGVHGKGFAVVAEEVGKLATISGKAAEEIRLLLESSSSEVTQIVRSTQERVKIGRSTSHECEIAFNAMSQALQKISESIRVISTATREQDVGIKQTNKAMHELDLVTQRNSAAAETLSKNSARLAGGAASLTKSISGLRVIVLGDEARRADKQVKIVEESRPEDKISGPGGEILEEGEKASTSEQELDPQGAQASPKRSDSRWKAA